MERRRIGIWCRAALAIAALAGLSGCMIGYPGFTIWQGFRPPIDSDVAAPVGFCPSVHTQNLKPEQRQAFAVAYAEACTVIASSEFRRQVEARTWLSGCGTPRISGAEAYTRYASSIPAYSVIFRNPVNAIALTNSGTRRIAIRPSRLRPWQDGTGSKAELIGTLAHEMTHLVPGTPMFTDGGHGTAACPDSDLVSYGFGNIAMQVWQARHP